MNHMSHIKKGGIVPKEMTVAHIKVGKKAWKNFGEIVDAKYDKNASAMIRDIVNAVNEGRMTITPTDGQKELFGIKGEDK